MFGKDFYPTPRHVVDRMLFGKNLKGKVVLEPEAGKGDIVIPLKEYGAKVIACEINFNLAKIVMTLSDEFLKHDFFKVKSEEISHVDFIIMNPPFSSDEKHILHAFEIAPEGCTITALCNYESVSGKYSFNIREELKSLVDTYGTVENISSAFTDAERKTDVEIGLINLYKPKTGDSEFEGYFDMEEETDEGLSSGLVTYNVVRDIVNRYVEAVKKFNSVMSVASDMNTLISAISSNEIYFGAYFGNNRDNRWTSITRDVFKKHLQKAAWKTIFNKMDMEKFVTKSLLEYINKFVEQQTNVPFTFKNVYAMIELIAGTHKQRMEKVVEQAFDHITKYYSDNRYQLEGWKTNSEYRVNKRFILPNIFKPTYEGKMTADYGYRSVEDLDDLYKALCYLTAQEFDHDKTFYYFVQNYQMVKNSYGIEERRSVHLEFNTWYDWTFFKFKGFKKGTLHMEFKDEKLWDEFNSIACRSKGFRLAEKYTSDFRTKGTDVEVFKKA